jgi:hypothetical protein
MFACCFRRRTTITLDANIFDSLFHSAALAAYLEVATASGGPPDPETTKRLAYRLYEEALGDKNAARNSLASTAEDVASC